MTSQPHISASVTLPWPDRILHPNERPHWAVKARTAKKARQRGAVETIAAGFRRIEAEALKVTITFTPPDNRPRDTDGMLSSLKSYLDGVADVIGVDDSRWRITMCRETPAKPGCVRVVLEAADTWEHISEPIARVIASIPQPKRGAA